MQINRFKIKLDLVFDIYLELTPISFPSIPVFHCKFMHIKLVIQMLDGYLLRIPKTIIFQAIQYSYLSILKEL